MNRLTSRFVWPPEKPTYYRVRVNFGSYCGWIVSVICWPMPDPIRRWGIRFYAWTLLSDNEVRNG